MARKPVAIVHGNCQAEPTRRLLSAALGDSYSFIRTPPVHLASANAARRVRHILPSVALFVAQPVRERYRGLDLGTNSYLQELSEDARIISIPSIYFRGYHPYLVYVNSDGYARHRTSIGEYHDLRTIEAARRGLSGSDAATWVSALPRQERYLRSVWGASVGELRKREPSLTVRLTDRIIGGPDPMFTLNHPPMSLIVEQCRQVVAALGHDPDVIRAPDDEPFEDLQIPPDYYGENSTTVASPVGKRDWLVYGKPIAEKDVIARNVAHYAKRPDILTAAIDQHASALATLFQN